MTERTDWPVATLTPLARARALAAGIPGAGYLETVFDVPYEEAWPRLSDIERSVPAADRAVRRITIEQRRRLDDGAEELRMVTTSPFGVSTAFTARMEDGFGLMRAKGRVYVVVMAAEPTDDGRTRFGQLEAVPRRWGRILRWLMRFAVADDLKGFRKVASGR
jgi:hypothetical protein